MVEYILKIEKNKKYSYGYYVGTYIQKETLHLVTTDFDSADHFLIKRHGSLSLAKKAVESLLSKLDLDSDKINIVELLIKKE